MNMAKVKTPMGWFHYKRKNLFLGIKRIDKTIAFDNLKLILEILDKNKIFVGPILGTLLGIIRENDFISWDEDIDLFIFKEDEDKLKILLQDLHNSGLELVRYERRGLYSFMRNGEYIDIYILRYMGGGIRNSGAGEFFFDKDLKDFIKFDFNGLLVNVPRNYDRFLQFLYGDWRTPVQYANFEMGFLHKNFVKAKHFIKNNLPDFLYYPLLRWHHLKDYKKFCHKCELYNIKLSDEFKF